MSCETPRQMIPAARRLFPYTLGPIPFLSVGSFPISERVKPSGSL